ncbi:hypothetical protein O179_02665 [Chlamydia trachomatis]|uniref:hypothetical protein n=1 Tax=Chlamydia trachomatis TaxID=813 RepID=UPI00038DC358|nr:hypothetical protein [Chlamydia trachomatis]AGT71862.1 hypothetical protein O179_02665 [Chlamydia trachomatis]
MDFMSVVPQSPCSSPTNFYGRLSVSWRASLSPRARYEVGSLLAIVGLILTLIGAASIHAVLLQSVATPAILSFCSAFSIRPLATAIFSVIVGLALLIGGIFLLPVQQETPHSSLRYLATTP